MDITLTINAAPLAVVAVSCVLAVVAVAVAYTIVYALSPSHDGDGNG